MWLVRSTMDISLHHLVDQWLSSAPTPIIVNVFFIFDEFPWSRMTMPTSHISNDGVFGSNVPYHFIKYPMRSTTIIVFPLWNLVIQPRIDTYIPKDPLSSLLSCHVCHDIIIHLPRVNKSHGRPMIDIPLVHRHIDGSHHIVDFLCHWYLFLLLVHPHSTSDDDVSEIYNSSFSRMNFDRSNGVELMLEFLLLGCIHSRLSN